MLPSVERSRDYLGFDCGFGDVAWTIQSICHDVAQENGVGSACTKNRQWYLSVCNPADVPAVAGLSI
jgi:hypothetical protein